MGDTLNMAEAYHIFGLIHGEDGSFTASEKFFEASIGLNEGLEYQEGLAETYTSYGNLCSKQSKIKRAKNCYEKALEAYQELGLQSKVDELSNMIKEITDSGTEVKIVEMSGKEKGINRENASTVHHS